MNHAVARFAQPCQIGNFIDSFDWKLVVDVVTVFWNCYGKWFPAAFALSLIPVIGVFPVHEAVSYTHLNIADTFVAMTQKP